MEIFIPFSERLIERTGMMGRLVPFQLEYPCARLHGWASVEILPEKSARPAAADDHQPGKLQPH